MSDKKTRVLLVEDEVEVAKIVRDYLHSENYEVEIMHTGAGVVESVRAVPPDLILLDIMLPEVDGVTICKEVRSFSKLPIIMLTAKVDEVDRLLGYDLGADDYICKPVNPREILARVKAVLRRSISSSSDSPPLLDLDESRLLAIYKGQRLDLTVMEFGLLKLLYSRNGKILSRKQLQTKLNTNNNETSERAIDTCIKKLRRKMGEVASGNNPIHSVYGLGYKFEGDGE